MSFASRSIAGPLGGPLPITKIVLHRADRDALDEASDYAQTVRRDADALIARAREQAASLVAQTSLECAERLRTADAALLGRAIELEARYRHCRDAFAERLETTLDAALGVAIKALAATVSPAQRMRICTQALRDCLGTGTAGCLFISADDATALDGAADIALPWAVRADASLAPGTCRLEVEGGAWEIKWELIVERLLEGD